MFSTSWNKATSVKSKPLTVGSAEELIRKHFSEKAGFARKIGTTWIFLQWVRLIGVVVELIALIYLAVKVLTRRYSSQPGALCHSIYLFLNGSAEERVEKIKSKTKKHVRDASGKFHLRKLSGKEDEDDAEAGVAEQKVSALITSNNSYLEKKRKNRQKFNAIQYIFFNRVFGVSRRGEFESALKIISLFFSMSHVTFFASGPPVHPPRGYPVFLLHYTLQPPNKKNTTHPTTHPDG